MFLDQVMSYSDREWVDGSDNDCDSNSDNRSSSKQIWSSFIIFQSLLHITFVAF
jgi:hypothetical protein